jgi:5-methylcytosine-specific restriction endonuclease McrA
MFQNEAELLQNLIVLSPKQARKRFRQSIFEAWNWECAYCGCQLTKDTATIDHIIPKHKGGESLRSNMLASCCSCNGDKASQLPFEYYVENLPNYSKEREVRIKAWLAQTEITSVDFDWHGQFGYQCA